jgi:hypothetical protein
MKIAIALFALLTAVAVALPVTIDARDDSDPVMTNANADVVPFDSDEVVTVV